MVRVLSARESTVEVELRSKWRAYCYCLVMCLGAAYNGYSLTLISASSTPQLIEYYHVQLPMQTMLSLLNGFLPLGAIVGCFLVPPIMPFTNKKQIHYILLPFTVIQCMISILPAIEAILVSRFLLGILNAFYTSVPASYIKEVFPACLKSQFGAIYSCGRVSGILVCFTVAEIYDYREDILEHNSIFLGLTYMALLQAILIFFFLPHSPIEMLGKGNEKELMAAVKTLYECKDLQRVILQLKGKLEMGKRMTVTLKGAKIVSRKNILSYHLALLRQFCGVTFIIVYSRQLMTTLGPNLANQTPVIINSVNLASSIIGIFLVSRLPRRRMIVYSTLSLAVVTLVIGIVDLLQLPIPTLVSMTIFMFPCGAFFNSVLWSYPSELASAARGKYASMMNWIGTALVTLIPPYILKAMPNRSAYPIFFFFSAYLVFGAVLNRYVLISVETLEVERKEMKRIQLLGQ